MAFGDVVGGTTSRIYILVRPPVLRIVVLLVILWIPLFLQAAPVMLRPNWRVTTDPNSEQLYCAVSYLCFGNVISSDGSYYFGFASSTSEGLSTLAVAFIANSLNSQPVVEVVWRANRNSPVRDNATLSLISGNLELHDSDTRMVWSTGLNPGKSITSIDMQSNGNLVMRDANNQTLWESFSHPTDALMPGQRLKYKMALIAGSSQTNSSEGIYKMVMESEALVLYTSQGSPPVPQPYWMSAHGFTVEALMRSQINDTTAYIDTNSQYREGVLMYFSLVEDCNSISNCPENLFAFTGAQIPIYNFLRLDYDGVLRWNYFDEGAFTWKQITMEGNLSQYACLYPSTPCGPYGICSDDAIFSPQISNCTCPSGEAGLPPIFQYANASQEWQGCNSEWNSTSCVNGNLINDPNNTIDLLEVNEVTYFANQYMEAALLNGSPDECKTLCLKNCSCAASFFWNNSTASVCHLGLEPLLSMYTTSSLSAGDLPQMGGQYFAFVKYVRKKKDLPNWMSAWRLGAVISSGGLFLLSVCTCVVIVVIRARSMEEDIEFLGSLPELVPPKTFSFKELDTATKHFSTILGAGGFGTVYEGMLPNGNKVAVKRLERSRQGEKEFTTEVETIALNHQHLVHLWGFCSEGAHRMLVYECMNNGSLDRWLFREAFLGWANRYQIALDTAKGLSYLHQDCRHKIVHLDVKPQNILLDDQFRAKVADFGMSKFFDEKRTEVMTNMRGTRGYLAPEWLLQAGITVKCDVYSYGMVLFEIVTGRKNVDANASPEKYYFPAWAVQRMQEQTWSDIVDASLLRFLTSKDWVQVKKMVKIAMWCIQDSPRLRPTMAMVVQMLEGVVEVDDPPLQFDFLTMGFSNEGAVSISNSTACTISNHSSEEVSNSKVEFASYCNPDSNSGMSPR